MALADSFTKHNKRLRENVTSYYVPVEFASAQLKSQHLLPVLGHRELLNYVECVVTDRCYEPPVSYDGLGRTFRAAVQCETQHPDQHVYPAPFFKRAGIQPVYS